jgi:chromate reductase, NAD(P)H dehydrogenase (quinone)
MILIIAGTNRPDSNAMKVARVLYSHYTEANVEADIYTLQDMPGELFSPGSYATKPAAWLPVQQRILQATGLHIVTPEYNGSFPGALKYFIDMLKFPESFEHKPVAFTGESAGIWGGLRAVEQLQHIFGYRNAYICPERVFIPAIHTRLDDAGRFIDVDIDKRLMEQTRAFAAFVKKLNHP